MDGDPVTYDYPASYGFNRMRLMAPVLVDSRIRGGSGMIERTTDLPRISDYPAFHAAVDRAHHPIQKIL